MKSRINLGSTFFCLKYLLFLLFVILCSLSFYVCFIEHDHELVAKLCFTCKFQFLSFFAEVRWCELGGGLDSVEKATFLIRLCNQL